MSDSVGSGTVGADGARSPLEVELAEVTAGAHPRRNGWLRRLVILAVCFAAAYSIVQLVGRIDWAAVRDALGHLEWWQALILVGGLLVRQTLNALPLAFFIRGLGIFRAVVNDLAAHLLAVVAPPPSDLALRVGMFTSWGIDASRAIAGSLMNTLVFYVIRFSVPVIGVIVLLPVRFDSQYAVVALVSSAAAGTIAVVVALAARSEDFAKRAGHHVGTAASRVKSNIDPDHWAGATLQFRANMKDTFAAGLPRSAIALVGLVFSDATVLLLALRFVGVGAGELPMIELFVAFLVVYPMTLLPFMGLGIVDALLLAIIVDVAGADVEAAVIAALVVWRVVTLGGPVLLGAGAMAVWRHSVAGQNAEAEHLA